MSALDRTIKVKCRVIAATNKDLETMIEEGKFREDLYHRLNVVRIETAPLRLRMEDIPDLAKLFTLQIGGANFKIEDKALRALNDYDWPGNIRELRNTVERACISARRRSSPDIIYEDIAIQAPKNTAYRLRQITCSLPNTSKDLTPENYKEFFAVASREFFRAALEATNGNISEIASRIGIGRTTVFRRIVGLGLTADKKMAASKSHSKFFNTNIFENEKQREI